MSPPEKTRVRCKCFRCRRKYDKLLPAAAAERYAHRYCRHLCWRCTLAGAAPGVRPSLEALRAQGVDQELPPG